MPKTFILAFIISAIVSLVLTAVVKKYALKKDIVDRPAKDPKRKIHENAMPLLGGVAIFFAFQLTMWGYAIFTHELLGGYIMTKHLIALMISGLCIMIGGYLDDRFFLPAKYQIPWVLLAITIIIIGGVGAPYITNPFGNVIPLDSVNVTLFHIHGVPYKFTLFADIFTTLWILGMSYTTKLLDGLDGLVAGITTIAAIVLCFLSITPTVGQPETALLFAILGGSFLGFLLWNYHPAKIFLGEGGSLYAGFMLGTLSILSGAKIATALLLLGVPVLDVVWVLIRRIFVEKKNPFKTADKQHLHFRLLSIGLSHRGTVNFLYLITLVFGITGLLFSGRSKAFALLILCFFMVVIGVFLISKRRKIG